MRKWHFCDGSLSDEYRVPQVGLTITLVGLTLPRGKRTPLLCQLFLAPREELATVGLAGSVKAGAGRHAPRIACGEPLIKCPASVSAREMVCETTNHKSSDLRDHEKSWRNGRCGGISNRPPSRGHGFSNREASRRRGSGPRPDDDDDERGRGIRTSKPCIVRRQPVKLRHGRQPSSQVNCRYHARLRTGRGSRPLSHSLLELPRRGAR